MIYASLMLAPGINNALGGVPDAGNTTGSENDLISESIRLSEEAILDAKKPLDVGQQRIVSDAINFSTKTRDQKGVAKGDITPFDTMLLESVRPLQSGLLQHMPNISSSSDRFGISDEDMADARLEAMKAFGIDHGVNGYILVSRSMPDSLIRAYALDATRLGFTIAVKGMPESETDILNYLSSLGNDFHTTGSTMSVQIDPRLFDVFDVDIVPTIVLTDKNSNDLCNADIVEGFEYRGQVLPLRKCKPLLTEEYCKISGAVFTDWAIETMAKNGCHIASEFQTNKPEDRSQINVQKNEWEEMTSKLFSEMKTGIYNDVLLKTLEEPPFK